MKDNRSENSAFERLMNWMDEDPFQEQEHPEAPHHAEFMEYLEYLDSHEYMEFRDYCAMRAQERASRGITGKEMHGHEPEPYVEKTKRPRDVGQQDPVRLRAAERIYQVLSVLITAVLTGALVVAALNLPAFGDPKAPTINKVSERYLEDGVEETGAVNAVAGMILDYRAFDTFGESTVLFAATMSVVLLLRDSGRRKVLEKENDRILKQMGRIILPAIMMYGVYVVLNGHLSPGGGFSGGTVLGCGLILAALALGEERMEQLLPPRRLTRLSVGCLLAYGLMKGYSFLTGANHLGWDVPKGTPGAIFSAGFILPLNICVGIIVACTMYTFYTLFVGKEE